MTRLSDVHASSKRRWVSSFARSYDPVSWRSGVVVDALPQTQVFGQYTYAVAPVATILLISQGNAALPHLLLTNAITARTSASLS